MEPISSDRRTFKFSHGNMESTAPCPQDPCALRLFAAHNPCTQACDGLLASPMSVCRGWAMLGLREPGLMRGSLGDDHMVTLSPFPSCVSAELVKKIGGAKQRERNPPRATGLQLMPKAHRPWPQQKHNQFSSQRYPKKTMNFSQPQPPLRLFGGAGGQVRFPPKWPMGEKDTVNLSKNFNLMTMNAQPPAENRGQERTQVSQPEGCSARVHSSCQSEERR